MTFKQSVLRINPKRLLGITKERNDMKSNKKSKGSSAPFKRYAIALSLSKTSLSKIQKAYPPLSKGELEPAMINLTNQFFYQIGIGGHCIGLTYHVFGLTNAELLSNLLSKLPDVQCYAIQDLSDEALALRYFAAIRALRKAQYKVEKTAYFAKPSKQLVSLYPQADQDLTAVRSVIEHCRDDLKRQHEGLTQTLIGRLLMSGNSVPRETQTPKAA